MGSRGVPANYGGFETAAEQIGQRLVRRGHEITVYCRQDGPREYLGMRRVRVPAIRRRVLETLSHTCASCLHACIQRPDVAIVFNAANSPLLPLLKMRRIPTAVHVDGLEWRRGKWSDAGRRYYLRMEGLAVAWADALIADADAIANYYRAAFGVEPTVLRYGAPVLTAPALERLGELGLRPGRYHLVVARLEPENHVELIVQGYRDSTARHPLVVIGGNAYATDYTRRVTRLLAAESRIVAPGAVYDQGLLDALYAGCLTYSHGHSVGGTNPSLLRAMGAGAAVLAMDNQFNREVLGGTGQFFDSSADLAHLFETLEADPATRADLGRRARARAAVEYDWDQVALGYEALCRRLVNRPGVVRALRMARDGRDPAWMPARIPASRPGGRTARTDSHAVGTDGREPGPTEPAGTVEPRAERAGLNARADVLPVSARSPD
jgi:glycosyltransferase involved in cell wall biosynthesis